MVITASDFRMVDFGRSLGAATILFRSDAVVDNLSPLCRHGFCLDVVACSFLLLLRTSDDVSDFWKNE